MSEVAKMYKNAGVELYYCTYPRYCEVFMNNKCNYDCDFSKSRFTPEKQLELICWLVNNKDSIIITNKPKPLNLEVLKESIAYGINLLWQDLTESDQEQIRSILNG